MHASDILVVTCMTPDEVLYTGKATSLSSKNSEGVFDIISDHARFMTLISEEPIVINEVDGSTKTLTFETSVLFFHDNEAKIYVHTKK